MSGPEARDRYGERLGVGDLVEDAIGPVKIVYRIYGIASMDEIFLETTDRHPYKLNYSVSSFEYALKEKAKSAFDRWVEEFEGRV